MERNVEVVKDLLGNKVVVIQEPIVQKSFVIYLAVIIVCNS